VSTEFSVELTRTIAAPRERVYRAFVDPEKLRRWLSPPRYLVTDAVVEERVGGRHRVELRGVDDEQGGFDSVIRELVPGERLVLEFTFVGPEPHAREDTLLTVTLCDAADGGTEVRLLHERIGLAPPFDERSVNAGWNGALDKLVALFDDGS
jgi:uncharacterized protein YndB with AHSA1/START domain